MDCSVLSIATLLLQSGGYHVLTGLCILSLPTMLVREQLVFMKTLHLPPYLDRDQN